MDIPTIRLIDRTQAQSPGDLSKLRDALQRYVNEYVGPAWGVAAKLVLEKEGKPAKTDWQFLFIDDADAADALGYHDVSPTGQPLAKIFTVTTVEAGEQISVTASHEVAEMVIDPSTAYCVYGPRNTVYALEICDPVQERSFKIDGIAVSDFAYPAWFEEFRPAKSTQFSQLKTVTKPFAIDRGGYMPVFRAGKWTQIFGSTKARARYKRTAHLRNSYYGDPSPWRKSKPKKVAA